MSGHDPVGQALWSIGAGGAAGAACMTGGIITLRMVQSAGTPGARPVLEFSILTVGLIAGVILAVSTAVRCTGGIRELWRRGVTGTIGAFLAVILTGISAPVDIVTGVGGVFVFFASLVAVAMYATRRARAAVS